MARKRFGMVLKKIREAQGLTQEELATKAKLHRVYLAQLETGTKRNPSLAVAQRLAKALGVPLTELLE